MRERRRGRERKGRRAAAAAAAVLSAAALVALVVLHLPGVLVDRDLAGARIGPKDRLSAVNDVRATLLQAVAGLAIFAGAYVTWRQVRIGQEGLKATREGQVTDRFGLAVEQIGSDKPAVRIGGLHALWRVADHSDREREAVIAIMAAFLRTHLRWPPTGPGAPAPDTPINSVPPLETRAPDAQTALTCMGVLCEGREPEWLNLIATDLRRADCDGQNFQGVIFDRACLEAASLFSVNLTRASLAGAVLRHAELTASVLRSTRLTGADLRGALLIEAELEDTDLTGADLREANLCRASAPRASFRRADLRMADLRGADLSGADLREARLEGARVNDRTRWPEGFDVSDHGVLVSQDPESPTNPLPGLTLRTDLPPLRSYP
ncbi:pentapeptide repeat-containing protein [Streptomyces chitinivorans]|uniref:Pentapeptide repeat-containing protein n=1 Tax=Streptomyces chitinivorans TaxID=1257027 RepID=A0ABW7HY79_9ACTN|nr:pentapeptide repeat-containing protein [Streptomyces chitinivorans]MDH2409771.1 pentapeptide repeat-containing protein [Streptomyces chitinivorans]